MEKKDTFKLIIAGAFGVAGFGLLAGCVPFILPALRKVCLPYVPATDRQVQNVLQLLKKQKGNVIDLGSGDGRIVLASAKLGLFSVGVELNPWLVLYSKIKAYRLGLNRMTSFKRQDIWKTNLSKFQNVVIFGVDEMMPQLEKKLEKELKDDGCIMACRFPLPTWEKTESVGEGIDTVWLYEKKSQLDMNKKT